MRALRRAALTLAVVLAFAVPAAAQNPPPGLLAKSIRLDVRPDRFPQFEEALRQHLAFHSSNQDSWSWHTWQVVNGEGLGRYYLRSNGLRWEDFDAHPDMRRSDWADFLTNVAPHLQSMASTIDSVDPSLSNWPAPVSRPKLVAVTRFELTFDGFREFRDALEKLHQAMTDKAADRHYAWTSTVNGSTGPEMTLLVPLASWADLEPRQPTLWAVIEEVYGPDRASVIRTAIEAGVRGIHSSVVAYREDLSYEPVTR
jgi:hypothetical protein